MLWCTADGKKVSYFYPGINNLKLNMMTTYFGLKTDIREIKDTQQMETRVNNLRLKVLENQVAMLQKQVDEIKLSGVKSQSFAKVTLH